MSEANREKEYDEGEERSDNQKGINYCAVGVYGRCFAPPVLHSSLGLTFPLHDFRTSCPTMPPMAAHMGERTAELPIASFFTISACSSLMSPSKKGLVAARTCDERR